MKKITAGLLAFLLTVGLTACGDSSSESKTDLSSSSDNKETPSNELNIPFNNKSHSPSDDHVR